MSRNAKIWLGAIAVIAVLAWLFPVGRDPVQTTTFAEPKFEKITKGQVYAMLADPAMPAEKYLDYAKAKCVGQEWCKVMGWTDAKNKASAMPMLQREVDAQVFDYTLNRSTDLEQALWNCRVFKGKLPTECLAESAAGG